MLRLRYVVMVGSVVICSLFACGDKINPKGSAPTGGTLAGGTTGEGGTTDIGGMDGGDSEAGVAFDGGGGGVGGSTTASVSYSKTIAPMMAKSCATSTTCHSAGNPWSVDLDTYAGVKANATASISAIQGHTMPPSGTFSDSDLKSLQAWVNAGYPNN